MNLQKLCLEWCWILQNHSDIVWIILLGYMYRPIQYLKTKLNFSESLLDKMNTLKACLSI